MQNTSSTGSTQSQKPNLAGAWAQMAKPTTTEQPKAPRRKADVLREQRAVGGNRNREQALLGVSKQIADANAGKVQHGPKPAARKYPSYIAK